MASGEIAIPNGGTGREGKQIVGSKTLHVVLIGPISQILAWKIAIKWPSLKGWGKSRSGHCSRPGFVAFFGVNVAFTSPVGVTS